MAYAKSKASYPAWVHSWVDIMATSARNEAYTLDEIGFPTEGEAKKARFQLYGFIAALEHEKPKKNIPEAEVKKDREMAKLAKQWSIGVDFSQYTGNWELSFTYKNSPLILSPIYNVIHQMEEKLKDIRLKEYNAAHAPKATLANYVSTPAGPPTDNLPDLPSFYGRLIEKLPSKETQTFVRQHLADLPNPYVDRESEEILTEKIISACGTPADEFFRIPGMTTFCKLVWDNAGYLVEQEKLKA